MKRIHYELWSAFLAVLLLLGGAARARQTRARSSGWELTRVSVGPGGREANADSWRPGLSADGRWAVFESAASNLVEGDYNGARDVFARDRETGATTRLSVSATGAEGDADSVEPAISADGRFVALSSAASNLLPAVADANGRYSIYVVELANGAMELVSRGLEPANADATSPALSGDGRVIAFASAASNLVADDANGVADVFVYDRAEARLVCLSRAADGATADGPSGQPALSADGRYVAFVSEASNLVAADDNGCADVFLADLATGVVERLSVSSDGAPANGHSAAPALSADGRYVAYSSRANNLAFNDPDGEWDIYLRDRGAQQTTCLSPRGPIRDALFAPSLGPAISADGQSVIWESWDEALAPGDANAAGDVLHVDLASGLTRCITCGGDGQSGLGLALSADGRVAAFVTEATNLAVGDGNGALDVLAANLALAAAPPWDVNGDGACDVADVVAVTAHWGETGAPGWIAADVNADGVIDINDIVALGQHWGQTW